MHKDEATRGVIFNVQTYSIHDGPGIRTTVFIKGCPLRCVWCQNPESQVMAPQLFFNNERCVGCGKCLNACPEGAIKLNEGKSWTDRDVCKSSGKCVEVCPHEARNIAGKYMTAGDVFKTLMEDKIFYDRSGGGVTLGGGEPLASPDFTASLLRLCKNAGIHTALDTCGYAKWEIVKQILPHVDLVLFDLKHMDPAAHRLYTGVTNEVVLENARRICQELHVLVWARIPVIPGFNDSSGNIEATGKFIASKLGASTEVYLLPYHRLGEMKYHRLERPGNPVFINPPDEKSIFKLKEVFESFGLKVHEGG
ncbi:MAG: glycyl-radical enzyme activating protein [Dehalococcoidales bacterium]|nr:glycyl-radical enzyme activating protein [Dehalococcoidales bacterium]